MVERIVASLQLISLTGEFRPDTVLEAFDANISVAFAGVIAEGGDEGEMKVACVMAALRLGAEASAMLPQAAEATSSTAASVAGHGTNAPLPTLRSSGHFQNYGISLIVRGLSSYIRQKKLGFPPSISESNTIPPFDVILSK